MDEFQFHTPESKTGILFIRALEDDDVVAAAWDRDSVGYQVILNQLGEDTNLSWITARAAEVAYDRGLIDETEFNYLSERA